MNRQKVEKRLVDLLEAPTALVRIRAASALNLIDGPLDRAIQVSIEVAATPPKIWPLRDGKRMYAEGDASYTISTLGSLGERAAICVPTLIELLKSEDMGVHINSIGELGQIGIAASIAVPALEKELLDSESLEQGQEDETQWLAACGLAMIDPHNPKIRPILEPLFFEGMHTLNRSDHLALIEMISAGVEFDAEFRSFLRRRVR